jgi:hypothetical protein
MAERFEWWINTLCAVLGQWLLASGQLLVVIPILGFAFMTLTGQWMQWTANPYDMLRVQALSYNYAEVVSDVRDPNWDGAASGLMLGLAFSNTLPVIGPAVAPVVGAVMGYRMDAQL